MIGRRPPRTSEILAPTTGTARRPARARRVATAVIALTALVAACGADTDVDQAATLDALMDQLTGAELSDDEAVCVAEAVISTFDTDEIAAIVDGDIDDEVAVALDELTDTCLADVDAERADEPAADPTATAQPVPEPEPTAEPDTDDEPAEPTATPVPSPTPIVATAEFCAASHDAYEAFITIEYLSEAATPGAVQATFARVLDTLRAAVAAAPSADLTEEPQAALDAFIGVNQVTAEAGYDVGAAEPAALQEHLTPFLAIMDLLEEYLRGPCAIPDGNLEGDAASLARDFEAAHPPPTPVPADELIEIDDPATGIQVAVPADWDDVGSVNEGGVRALVATPDLVAFESSWDVAAVTITAFDGTADWESPVGETAAVAECTLASSGEYDDGTFTGELYFFEACGGGTAQAIVVGATNPTGTVAVVVEIQMPTIDDDVVTTIFNSFLV